VVHRRLAQSAVGFTAVVILAVSVAVSPAASAAPSISQARAKAARLRGEIAALNGQMAVVAERFNATAQRLNIVDGRIADNQRRLAVARYELAVAHRNLADRVVAMYKAPATGYLDVALSARSFDDLVSRMRLWDGVFAEGRVAVATVERSRAEVQRQGVRLAGDRRQAVELLAQVAAQRTEIAAEVQRGQALLAAAQTRVKVLVKQMKARKAAAEAAVGYRPVTGVAGAYTPLSWAQALLGYLGLPVTAQNLTAITAWELAEGGNWFNSARYNPLDTTMDEPGASAMNSVGVKAYTSWAEGFTATVATLDNGLYGPILAALRKGDDALAVAAAVAASPWGTGAFGV
jgi:peptidoglycan hydrolase CwlO-like protein